MKSTQKSNGTIAAGPQVGASCPPANDQNTANAAIFRDRQKNYPLSKPVHTSNSEEEAFRNFLLSRLPNVKAPQSLREKIKSLVKSSQP